MAQTSFAIAMLVIAASVALLLGVVGIYGVIAYVAAQRTREIGIRMALGAQFADVRSMFLRHGLRLTVTIALGVGAALAFSRMMSALLWRRPDGSSDVCVRIIATRCCGPCRDVRACAARVDPLIALRADA